MVKTLIRAKAKQELNKVEQDERSNKTVGDCINQLS